MSFLVGVSSITIAISHPLRLALSLIAACLLVSALLLKISTSWLFYLLVLMFLGGVMVVITYMSSLAANEKSLYSRQPKFIFWLLLGGLVILLLDIEKEAVPTSSFNFAGGAYGLSFLPALVSSFLVLFLALVRVVKLIKLEEGPLVKRL
jgi:NADH:ubiquinone oxidoreductase subunit 6 (subunit J)